ncbi:hypothetical protein BDV28DRAFT_41599 [Aspergillus coremiiformis]|uniref:DUF6603 domain-containing protein n=1 Tax=Aspergillus coremiiformis TaxID=138285 RepID=A0A5N6ZI19_9EURO|nr:hypothetical protein BDV28DRAFT_41599 [Aspergillus coremiiformis]
MAGEFIVESFHVSIEQSHGALHLLVERKQNQVKPTVCAAVLIEGELDKIRSMKGEPGKECELDRRPIFETFKAIEAQYDLGLDNQLRLTSILVAHCNDDRDIGIAKLLQVAAVQANASSTPIPWLRWNKDGHPETDFYTAWLGEATNQRFLGEGYLSYTESTVAITYNEKTSAQRKRQYVFARQHVTTTNCPWRVLGVNLFNNTALDTSDVDVRQVTPKGLVARNPPGTGQPGMYCVAINGMSLATRPRSVNWSSVKKVRMVPSEPQTDISGGCSIAAAIMWRPRTRTAPRASRYIVGDLTDKEEALLLDWLSRDDVELLEDVYTYNTPSESSTRTGLPIARSIKHGSLTPLASMWTLQASMENFSGALLAEFFPESVRDVVSPLLEHIVIERISVTYEYKDRKTSRFDMIGILTIGEHRFSLDFTNTGAEWTFKADMRRAANEGVQSTADNIITSLCGSDGVGLPDFFSNILVPTGEGNVMDLALKRPDASNNAALGMVLAASWTVNNLMFQFIQFRGNSPLARVKRVIVASLCKLSATPIPLLGDIPQPFDQVLFAWVQDTGAQGATGGLTLGELKQLNGVLTEMGKPSVPYKVLKKGATDQTMVLSKGLHFMVIAITTRASSEVILDYTFEHAKPGGPKESATQSDDANPGSRMVPLKKVLGPFSLRNIGLKYSTGPHGDSSILSVRLDASVMIGPIEFALVGLTLDMDFAKDGNSYSLHDLPPIDLTFEGLEAAFDKPPIQVGGILRVGKPTKEVARSYSGAMVISYMPWLFQAAGYFGEVTHGNDQFKSVFVYCILKGPLITLQFASIEGICGGFGYNSNLTFPTAKNVMNFPLIANGASNPPQEGTSALDALRSLLDTQWFFPRKDSFWVAAGLTVKAFEILSVQAVVVIQWNPYLELGIFGLATASIPGGKSALQFAYVQLGLVASINFETGVLKIEGELTPSSYILDPNCHLTGGFALYSWFDSKDSNLRGDWVFSIGGFHPSYKKPPQYPDPSRLGISWQFAKSISISGQAYFAITPKVCMGGGRLDLQLSLSPLYAYFNAFIDFLINYKPFHFIAEGGISVGVKFTLDLWLVTIKISVQIGARLYIKGPPIQGRVHVDFWVFGFDIDFGAKDANVPDPLSIDEFIDVVCQSDTPGAYAIAGLLDTGSTGEVTAGPEAHVFAVEEGLFPEEDIQSSPSREGWVITPTMFVFSISCKFAIKEVNVVTVTPGGQRSEPTSKSYNEPLHAKPMQANNIGSVLNVSIQRKGTSVKEKFTDPVWDDIEEIYSDIPDALWGAYNPSSDPSRVKNHKDLLNGTSKKTVRRMTGVRIACPGPMCSEDTTKPYNVEKYQVQALPPVNIPPMYPRPETYDGNYSRDKEQWKRVENTWNTPVEGANAAVTLVNLWTEVLASKMGWDEDRLKAGQQGQLSGAKPERLLADIPRYYLWAPGISKG